MRKITVFICILLLSATLNQVKAVYDPLGVPNNRYGIHIADLNDISDVAPLVNSNGGDWGYVTLVASDNDTAPELLVLSQDPPPGSSLSLGITTVTFTVSDASGNQASCEALVAVLDTTPPVVTLNGLPAMTVELGEAFVDPGAQGLDACSGTLPASRGCASR